MADETRKRGKRSHRDNLTERVYDFLQEWTSNKGCPPTLREIAHHLGYRSPNSIRYHLKRLEEMGRVKRSPHQARGTLPNFQGNTKHDRSEAIPILGRVTAGVPLMAEENRDGSLPLESRWLGSGRHFALEVQGDSMSGAGIRDGDLALVRHQETAYNGEIIVALLDGETTIKRFRHRGERIWLKPENPDYESIRIRKTSDFRILGTVVGLFRSLKGRSKSK